MSDATSQRLRTDPGSGSPASSVQNLAIECPPWLDDGDIRLYQGDCCDVLATLRVQSVQTCVTSPPYWGLRDYGTGAAQIGLETTPAEYVERMVAVFREVRRVLREDGTLWLNLGDSYANDLKWGGSSAGGKHAAGAVNGSEGFRVRRDTGLKPKDLVGIPWRVAFALQADGWYLRSDIVWSKPNPMPESVTDRPTKAHEYLFLLAKQARYFYDADAIREPATPDGIAREGRARLSAYEAPGQSANRRPPKQDGHGRRHAGFNGRWDEAEANGWIQDGRNRRSVWEIATQPFPEAHFATFPEALVQPCVLAGSRPGDVVLDPFVGSGTTALVARKHGRRCVGIDLNESYLEIALRRTQQLSLLASEEAS